MSTYAVKDKPLIADGWEQPLHLLERHGHCAYIELVEAKELNPAPLARALVD
jgi:hypothetical protein